MEDYLVIKLTQFLNEKLRPRELSKCLVKDPGIGWKLEALSSDIQSSAPSSTAATLPQIFTPEP